MNKNRRDFLKKATLGSIAITSAGSLSVFEAHSKTLVPEEIKTTNPLELTKPWEISFNEVKNELSLINGPVKIKGQINFYSEDKKWTISKSRDGVPDRYALIDTNDNVQGYFVLNSKNSQIQLLFYHRTAQAYDGELTFEGTINYLPDSFACRTKAMIDERVLPLSYGNADSLLNDSLFSPENDSIVQLDAPNLRITSLTPGKYAFSMSGRIQKSSEAIITINIEKDYFKNRYVPYYHPIDRTRCPKAPTGWMSWNTYFDKATADDNLAEAKIGQRFLQPFGCEFWSIESWQGNSDQLPVRDFYNMNLEVNEKQFPKGMKQLADDIRKLGFRPGIWMAPFGTGNKDFYEKYREWFLHDENGNPISSWNGRYTLDPTVKEAREHLKEIFRKASREWGYEFFKVDGMSGRSHGYCAHLYERPEIKERFQDPSCPNPFELCVQSFREGMGEDRIFLACQGHSSGPEAKYADASRIGADIVHPNKPVQWNNVLNQARCTINQIFTHNIVMVNDPDTLLVADLPIEEARVSTTIVALPGQLTFFGDKLANLSANKMKLLQQTLPVANVRPGSLYPYFSMLSIWNLNIHNDLLGDYNIVALFNWEDELKEISFTTEELGIDSNIEYSLFEFWTEKYFGEFRGTFSMNVPPHSVRLLAIHKIKQIPQWISSDRHVTQNALELKGFEWNDKARTITGKIELIDTFPLTMRIRIPKDYSFKKIECKDLNHSVSTENNEILAITFIAKKKGYYSFILKF
jgi:hypothetical protein